MSMYLVFKVNYALGKKSEDQLMSVYGEFRKSSRVGAY